MTSRGAASSLPFCLLAITPPTDAVDVERVAQWCDAAGEVPIALLLRTPQPWAALHPAGPLARLRAGAHAANLPVLWSTDDAALRQLLAADPGALDGLAGIQLRGDPDPSSTAGARALLAPGALLGRSVHGGNVEPDADVDFSVWAPVFTPRTAAANGRTKRAAGLDGLRGAAAALPAVVALGGVDRHTASACVAAGAYGLASIRAFFGPPAGVRRDVSAMAAAIRARDNFG